ncbi:auxin-responsive protein SAUR50-like [Senna tora]|uniref:Auxin-responsive protein SAUR50-like n=1 Tax=Senna tora TaxID=362788 RepID=A0A834SY50_9FABA|nr:auxin-responsive protein SAUR50-like [Senna tora]
MHVYNCRLVMIASHDFMVASPTVSDFLLAIGPGAERISLVDPAAKSTSGLHAKEEFGFNHDMGLTIPCDEVAFQNLTSMTR